MAEKITCSGPCGEVKDQTEFYGKSKKCKACTLARQKALKDAKATGGCKAQATKKVARKAKRAPKKAGAATKPENHALVVPAGGFGMSVTLEVDKDSCQSDVHLEQTTKDLGTQHVWLAQHEAQTLRAWLTEKLGDRG